MWDLLVTGCRLATMSEGARAPYGAMDGGVLGVAGGRISFVGPETDLPKRPEKLARNVLDAGGKWITPALIDCHTHLVFAGDRAGEFEQRLNGVSYQEIAAGGGGIMATMRAVRAASDDQLFEQSKGRFLAMAEGGIGTIEIKSGYGLDVENELKMLRVARRLGRESGVRVRTTLLGAHALPPEFARDRSGYVSLICDEMIPEAARAGLADAVDAYCEGIAFTPDETRRVFEAAKAAGLPVKLHADQFSDCGGAALAAEFGALSADHLEYTREAGARALAQAGSAAVLLPGAYYYLNEARKPPIEALRAAGAAMAVATDCNPGSSPVLSLPQMMNMACVLFGLTPEEALAGATRNGAAALGLGEETGTLEVGKAADFLIWDISHPRNLSYWSGGSGPESIFYSGVEVPFYNNDW